MGKEDQIIMTVPRKKLFRGDYFEGFKKREEADYEKRILENLEYKRRGGAENDPSLKQPIAYCILFNPKLKKVFVYRRASEKEHYKESRLSGKFSWGAGGHIEKIDGAENPIYDSLERELEEEFELSGALGKKTVLGYINDDSNDVGKVHFGILYLFETDSEEIRPKDKEAVSGEYMNFSDLKKLCSSPDADVETWSEIALIPLEKYVKGLF